MDYNNLIQKYYNKKFITTYIFIFIVLYLLTTFVKFLGQLPILLVITFILSIYFIMLYQSHMFYSKKWLSSRLNNPPAFIFIGEIESYP
jgi:hypothetical protein